MTSILAFVSLFLGLVVGPQNIELTADARVARIELLLDNSPIATLSAPPWRTRHDFGDRLLPRELVAVGFDSAGAELGRTRQWINLPRSAAEATLVLERDAGGVPTEAHLSWEAAAITTVPKVTAVLDGRPLAHTDPRRLVLPPLDPAQLHFLRVQLDFSDTVSSVVETVFGGTYTDHVTTDLTAVAIELTDREELPALPQIQGWVVKNGEPLEVVAAETGIADALFVRGREGVEGLRRIETQTRRLARVFNPADRAVRLYGDPSISLQSALPLSESQHARILWPLVKPQAGTSQQYAVFMTSGEVPPSRGGVYWLLTTTRAIFPKDVEQRIADGTAVAGMSAASRKRRRAVVLLAGANEVEQSQLVPRQAREYLRALQVPLRIWATNKKAGAQLTAWGEVEVVATAAQLSAAIDRLRHQLDRQRILWVKGTHLPQELTLSAAARGARIVE